MNLYKNVKIVTLSLVALLTFNSCDETLGDNVDPLAAVVIDPSLLFPQFMVAGSQVRTVENNAVNIISQQWASGGSAGVFANPEVYTISPFTLGNTWSQFYTISLRNASLARDLVETNNPEALNIIGQARVYESFIYLTLTQIYEDIPVSEAVQVATFPNPNFDSQEDALRNLIAIADEGIALLSTETAIIDNADLIYGGDRMAWIRFANSIKLKAWMLIGNVNPGEAAPAIQALVSQPLILDNSQNAWFRYLTDIGNENPLWRTLNNFAGGTNPFWFSGSTLVNIMNTNNDPRRGTYFDEEDGGIFVGQDQGVFSPTGISNVSLNILRPDLEDRLITASETNYFIAEAITRGWITGDANAFYRAGLEASLDSYDGQPGEIPAADKAAYLATRGSIAGLSQADALLQINNEQYVALFTRGIEAWTHWRRTGVPNFQIPVAANLSDIIRRYTYPAIEISSNPNAPDQRQLDEPHWFEN